MVIHSAEQILSVDYSCLTVQRSVFSPHLLINGEYSQNRSKSVFLARWADFRGAIPKTKPKEYQSEILHNSLYA